MVGILAEAPSTRALIFLLVANRSHGSETNVKEWISSEVVTMDSNNGSPFSRGFP